MFAQSTLLFTTLVLGALASVSQAALTLKTPTSMSMCSDIKLTPSGGVAPYTITVYKSCDDSDEDDDDKPITEFKSNNISTLMWTANVPEHQTVQLALTDAKGDVYYTDDMTVGSSKVGNCVGKPAQFSYLNFADAPAPASTTATETAGPPTTQVPTPSTTVGVVGPTSGPNVGVGAIGAAKNGAASSTVSFGLIALVSFGAIFAGTW